MRLYEINIDNLKTMHQFIFFELRTDNVEKAKKFYTKLFGWEVKEVSMGSDNTYPMLKIKVPKDFGSGITANPAKGKFPSHWTPYISVKNVAIVSKKAEKLGAKIAQKPKEYPWGIVSTILDPTGAAISLWQPKK